MRFCVRGCAFWPRLVAAPARAHPELPQCSCSPIGTFALPAPRQKSRFGDAFSACKEQISVATVTSSRNLSYHYTPRLGFKARTPAPKACGRRGLLRLCRSRTRIHEGSPHMPHLCKESCQTKFYKSLSHHAHHPFFTWLSYLQRVAPTSPRSFHQTD